MAKCKNEGLTERLTYELFEDKGFVKSEIIPKKTKNKKITELLKYASKKGSKRGEPDFFIINDKSDLIIIVECKPDIEHHKSYNFGTDSVTVNDVADYACDGVIHYASFLKDEYDIIAVAISGEDKHLNKIDTYAWVRGGENYEDLNLNEIRKFE